MLSMFVVISLSFSLFVVSICAPWVLSDHNKFLSDFVNQELLAFLGITVTISLASGTNIFLELNKMEEKIQKMCKVFMLFLDCFNDVFCFSGDDKTTHARK